MGGAVRLTSWPFTQTTDSQLADTKPKVIEYKQQTETLAILGQSGRKAAYQNFGAASSWEENFTDMDLSTHVQMFG